MVSAINFCNAFLFCTHIRTHIMHFHIHIHRYEQVDADRHIAECLQAVMDLEMENDLVLL